MFETAVVSISSEIVKIRFGGGSLPRNLGRFEKSSEKYETGRTNNETMPLLTM